MFAVKKIAIITSYFPPNDEMGGNYAYHLSKELLGMDVKVKVITLWKNESCGQKRLDTLDLACIPAKKVMNKFLNVKRKYYKTVVKEIQDFKPDCVVTMDYYRRLSFYGAKAAKELGIPCLTINHLSKPLSDKNKLINHFLKRYEIRMLHLHKKFRAVFAGAGQSQAQHLRYMNAVSRYEIPYGIDTHIAALPAAKKKMGIKSDTLLFALKQGEAAQNTQTIISAVKEISGFSGPDIALAVIGEKPKGMDIDEADVIFTGKISKEQELSIKYGCDVYVYFVKKYSLHRDLMEAGLLSSVAVCVLTEDELKFSMIKNLEDGIIVGNDIDEIKAVLQKLRLHTKLRAELSEKLKNNMELKHNWGQSALALVDAVWELNGGRRRAEKIAVL